MHRPDIISRWTGSTDAQAIGPSATRTITGPTCPSVGSNHDAAESERPRKPSGEALAAYRPTDRSRARWRALLALASALVLPLTTLSPAPAQSVAEEPGMLVSTEWVAERLGDEDLVLIQVGSRADYDAAHLPGARYLSLADISNTAGGLSLQMPETEELVRTFEAIGVSDRSTIVVYFGGNWVTHTARVYLTLDYLGLAGRAHLMDGGLRAWQAESRPVTTELPSITPGRIETRGGDGTVVDADWLADNLASAGVAVVDARTPDFYTGARGGGMPRAGHIPGAGNVPFVSIVDDETLKVKDPEALRELFRTAGVGPGELIVTYCHIGQQASLVYFAAKLLGYDARLYDGSFQEWSRLAELPVEWPAEETLPTLVTTQELDEMLAERAPTVIDLRSDLFEYLEGHVPGAVYLHYETLRATGDGVPADILDGEAYARLFSRLGIAKDRPVVIYGSGGPQNFNATFLAWILSGFQHPEVRLLDGGYQKWEAEGRAIARDYPEVDETEFPAEPFNPHVAPTRWVSWVVENAGTDRGRDMVLVDVRPVEQFEGRAGAQMRRGHIPGAVNHVWSSDLVSPEPDYKVWKTVDELRASYEAQGITSDKHVILYCNTGTEASHAYFALHNLLKYPNVDVYIPSWTDWSAREDLPIATETR